MTITPYDSAPLTEAETADLEQLEEIIAPGLQTFYLTGAALATIRDTRLYRANYPTFEQYCEGRWDLKRRRAYQLIEAAEVVSNVQKIAQIAPANEAQARSLATLPPEDQPLVFREALATAPNGKMSVPHIERTRERLYRVETQPAPYDLTERDPEPEPEPPAPSPIRALVPDAVIAPPNRDVTALVIDDDLRTLERRRIVANVIDRMYSVVREAAPLMRVADPDELAPLLSEYQASEEQRLMPTFVWVQAVFDARRAAQNIRRVK